MSDSRDTQSAAERAFELFDASGGEMSTGDLLAHLLREGYTTNQAQLRQWKSRNKWKAKARTKPLNQIALTEIVLGPKIRALAAEQAVTRLEDAQNNVLQLATGLSGALLSRIKDLKPSEITVRDIPGLADALGKMWILYGAYDEEVTKRRADQARDITPPPSSPMQGNMSPIAMAAQQFAAMRKGMK